MKFIITSLFLSLVSISTSWADKVTLVAGGNGPDGGPANQAKVFSLNLLFVPLRSVSFLMLQ